MSRNRDPLALSPHWHVDCRLESELPEDNLVGTRFLINVVFSAVALTAIIFSGWLTYLSLSLRYQIHDWEQRINDNRAEVNDINRMQREYSAEAIKIDQAFALIRPQLSVSSFVSSLGRTRPPQMVIDNIDWSDAGIIVRGSVAESSEQASQLLANYVKSLERDEKISPLFRVVLTDVDRAATGNVFKFEMAFRFKAPKS